MPRSKNSMQCLVKISNEYGEILVIGLIILNTKVQGEFRPRTPTSYLSTSTDTNFVASFQALARKNCHKIY